jgi:hypothetical protein
MSKLQVSHSLSGQLLWNFLLGAFPVDEIGPAHAFHF